MIELVGTHDNLMKKTKSKMKKTLKDNKIFFSLSKLQIVIAQSRNHS